VTEHGVSIDEHTMKFGLLMESAQAHQKLAEAHLEELRAHTQQLDGVVRQEIRRTFVDELQALTAETDRAAEALRKMQQAAHLRGVAWNIGFAVLCTAVPAAIVHFALPTEGEIAALRLRRDSLAQSVAHLERLGGKSEWRSCGEAARLCVRIDRKAPAYGEKADYFIVKGY
jgi:hypothetical protein